MAILHRTTRQLGGELSTTAVALLDELYAEYGRWSALEQFELERYLKRDPYAKWRGRDLLALKMHTSEWELLELALACWALSEASVNVHPVEGRYYGWCLQSHELLLAISQRTTLPGGRPEYQEQLCLIPSKMAQEIVTGAFIQTHGTLSDQGHESSPLFKTPAERDTFLKQLLPPVERTFTCEVVTAMQALISGERPGDRSD